MQTTEYQEIKQLFEQTFIIESITQFIRKVYLLLESKEYEDLISWHTDNQTVVIKDVKKLVHRVLPTVFKQKTLRSFVRQLNMYGFNKVKMNEESEELYFKNKNFMRGNFQDLVFIKRKQRGYVEKTKLEKNRQTNTFERYKIYTDGILGELKKEFLKKTKKSRFPELHAELEKIFHQHETMNYESLSNSASRSGSSLASHRSQNQIDIFHTIIPQPTPTTDLRLINMFESFQSVYQLPMFKSTFSLFGDHFQ